MPLRVVTISASFGAGGSRVGPALAERLGLPLIDRAIPAAVAESLAVPLSRAMAHDERSQSALGRILAKMASAVPYGAGPAVSPDMIEDPDMFRARTEVIMRRVADTTGGVVIGRAGAIVLAGYPGAFHVRLDGPRDRRLARAVTHESVAAAEAAKLLDDSDRAREAYVRHFYRCDPRDPRHYHLVIDSTMAPIDTCVEIILVAAEASFAAERPADGAPAAGQPAG